MSSNPCTRCGNERVAAKSWNETVGVYGRMTKLTHTDWVCTNPDCQKAVEGALKAQKDKRIFMENQKEQEKLARARQKAREASAKVA